MYRLTQRKQRGINANLTAWYTKLGFKLAICVPETPNQVLSKQIKTRLESFSGDKILINKKI